jgi:hypothetical protein
MDYIKNHGSTGGSYNDFTRGTLRGDQLATFNRTFKKLLLNVCYPNDTSGKAPRRIELKAFDPSNAFTHMIEDLGMSVAEYFDQKKQIPLQFPYAHLIKVKQGNQINYYPPEM